MRRAPHLVMAAVICVPRARMGAGAAPAAPAAASGGQAGRGAAGRGGPQGPQVVSPQVNADRTVTVRVLAPKATEITVTGELLNGSQPKADDQGRRWDLDCDARPAACLMFTPTRSTSTA